MQIITLNVNGIRSATKKGFDSWLSKQSPDILCLQELKASEDQIPSELQDLGYNNFFHPAEKKGYSGVGILSKLKPLNVQIGCGIDWIDREGRVLIAEYDTFFVFSLYYPSGTSGEERQAFKYQFLEAFEKFILDFRKNTTKELVLCGDMNIAHEEIDIHNPVSNKNSSGFLPEEREWFSHFLSLGFVDVFRELHQNEKDLYSWWSFRAAARKNNKGWRIDYQLATSQFAAKAKSGHIYTDKELSDHAPVIINYEE